MLPFRITDRRLAMRDSRTRLPFRYGSATLSRCPQAVLEVIIEAEGRAARGWSGDCLPPGWFDKTPGKPYPTQIREMLAAIENAGAAFDAVARREPIGLFDAWREADRTSRVEGERLGFPPLLTSFGISMIERALMDALARRAGLGVAEALRTDVYGIDPGVVHPELAGSKPSDWLPRRPLEEVFVRHTVGLADPLSVAEVPEEERLQDGLPQALEEYVERQGLRFFKVKLSGDAERDADRLAAFAEVVERRRGEDYRLTIDGNEQFQDWESLNAWADALRSDRRLETLRNNLLAIEQPLARSIALDPERGRGIEALSSWRPVILDESDGELDSYKRGLELGYRGVSSKNGKGAIKAVLNAGLTWLRNDRGRRSGFFMTGEDLCSVGIIPVQSDLALASTLGLDHVERNGHHYHPGLSYLPEAQRQAALLAHPDFYGQVGSIMIPMVSDGRFRIGSLHRVGYGFDVEPDLASMTPIDSADSAPVDDY